MDVADWMGDPQAEATILHELAHIDLDHDDDPAYAAARARDQEAGINHHRGPWEIEADALAAAMVQEVGDALTDPVESLAYLVEDAGRYP